MVRLSDSMEFIEALFFTTEAFLDQVKRDRGAKGPDCRPFGKLRISRALFICSGLRPRRQSKQIFGIVSIIDSFALRDVLPITDGIKSSPPI